MKRKCETVLVRLRPREIRHILDQFCLDMAGRYDVETKKWTYPDEIRKKLYRALK